MNREAFENRKRWNADRMYHMLLRIREGHTVSMGEVIELVGKVQGGYQACQE